MMKVSAIATRSFCLLFAFIFSAAFADEERVEVNFINFSPETADLFWQDGEEFVLVGDVAPYTVTRMETYIGETFAYGDKDDSESTDRLEHTVGTAKDIVGIFESSERTTVNVLCSTTKGDLRITVQPTWSPFGAARFLELVSKRYFDGCALNRVVKGFLTQFGIGADYDQRTEYRNKRIFDDVPGGIKFQPGFMAYAGSGKDSRTTEMFIVMPDTPPHQLNAFGQNPWETPFARVQPEDVQNVVVEWYAYGDMPPWGEGPDPQKIYPRGGYENYLANKFPRMDYINTCRVVESDDDVEEEL